MTLGQSIGAGRTAEVFAWGEGRILKLLRPGFPDRLAEEEAHVAELVASVYPGAPRCEGVMRVDGRLGVVFERVDGPSMDAYARRHIWALDRLARRLGELHAVMHDAPGLGLPTQAPGFHHAIDRAVERSDGRISTDAAAAAHRRVDALPADTRVCHGDFHPGNVLVGRRAVVIDWMTARSGSPAADVARTLYLLDDAALVEPLPGPMGWIAGAIRRRVRRGYLAAYRAARPLDLDEVAAWRLPILVARGAEDIAAERDRLRRSIAAELSPAGLPA